MKYKQIGEDEILPNIISGWNPAIKTKVPSGTIWDVYKCTNPTDGSDLGIYRDTEGRHIIIACKPGHFENKAKYIEV